MVQPRYVNCCFDFTDVDVGQVVSFLGCRLAVFLRLTSRSKSWAAFAKQDVICCRAHSVRATRAASSARRRSWITLSWVLVWTCRRRRLNRPPSYLT